MGRSFDPVGVAIEATGLREEALRLIGVILARYQNTKGIERARGPRLAGMVDRVSKDILSRDDYNPSVAQVAWLKGVAEGNDNLDFTRSRR